jgi:hypothetical protein
MNQKLNRLRQLLAAFILIAAIVGFSSCEKYSWIPVPINTADTIHFQTEIQPIFNANCVSCHTSIRKPDLRDGKSYESLTTNGMIDQPGETSILYLQMTTETSHIPRSSDADKQKVLIWINQGALNN